MRFSLFSLLWIAPFATAAYINNVKPTNNSESTKVTQHLYTHDANFHPDFYLSITYENLNIACEQRMSVLINGTSPGPELRLPPGKTSWIRVCNDMDDHNTTMVFRTLRSQEVHGR
jgi:L-ascorbate oxidase